MLFMGKWRKIWDLGLKGFDEDNSGQGFYDVVFDAKSAQNIWEDEDDRCQSDDDGGNDSDDAEWW